MIITVMPTGKTQLNPQEELIKDLTDQIWAMLPYSAKRNNKITWVMVYNVVRKAMISVKCIDTEKFNDYFDIRVVDPQNLDTIYQSLVNELSKYACADSDKLAYDADAVRAMTINYIMNAINECVKSACSDADINELIDLINDNRDILGLEYHRLISKVKGLRPVTKAISESESATESKPIESKPVSETPVNMPVGLVTVNYNSMHVATVLFDVTVNENWQLILRPRHVSSGSRVNDVSQENWQLIFRVR